MYNEKIKNSWIEEKQKQTINGQEVKLPKGALERSFEKISFFEERLGKDMCDFNTVEITEFYKTVNSQTAETLNVMNSYFRQYTAWCIQNNVSELGYNGYDSFKLTDFYSLTNSFATNKKIFSRQDILEICSRLDNYVDKFALLGLFEGIRGEFFSDFVNLKISDINSTENIIKLKERSIPVSKELINFGLEAYKEDKYTGVFGNAKIAHMYLPSEHVFKEYKQSRQSDEKKKGRRLQTKFTRIFEETGIIEWTNTNDIVISGMIYWLKEHFSYQEIEGLFYKTDSSSEQNKELFKNQFEVEIRTPWFNKYKGYF